VLLGKEFHVLRRWVGIEGGRMSARRSILKMTSSIWFGLRDHLDLLMSSLK
jgi:hypothetical protein